MTILTLQFYPKTLSKLYFIFLFIVSWTHMSVMAFNVLDSAWSKLNTSLTKQWTQLGQSSGGGWLVKALTDAVGTWLVRRWLVEVRCQCMSVWGEEHFEIKCKNPPWLMPLRKTPKQLKKSCSKEENSWKSHVKSVETENFLAFLFGSKALLFVLFAMQSNPLFQRTQHFFPSE